MYKGLYGRRKRAPNIIFIYVIMRYVTPDGLIIPSRQPNTHYVVDE